MRQPDWRCRIDEGVAGLVHCAWTPDSRHLVTFSDFQVHLTLWSLTTQDTVVVQKPKSPPRAVAFCASFMAVATRKDCKDFITVFDCDGWEKISSFPVKSFDLSTILWNEDGSAIVVLDTCLQYYLAVYSPTGELLHEYKAYEHALGIRTAAWSQGGAFLAVASFDQSVRLFNSLTWEVVNEFPHAHPKSLAQTVKCTGLLLATEKCTGLRQSIFVAANREDDFSLPAKSLSVDDSSVVPKVGVSVLRWSFDGRYLATKNENAPRVLWIWDVSEGGVVAIFVVTHPIRCVLWSPCEYLCCFATGGDQLYAWTPGRLPFAAAIDEVKQIMTIQWTRSGASLLLCSTKVSSTIHIGDLFCQSEPNLDTADAATASVAATIAVPAGTPEVASAKPPLPP